MKMQNVQNPQLAVPKREQSMLIELENGEMVEIAAEYMSVEKCVEALTHVEHNRKRKKTLAAKYARLFSLGLWRFNGETIIFTRSGQLTSGQHRCEGAVKSGKGFWTFVVRGIEDEYKTSIDTGLSKNMGDFLHMDGEREASKLAAAVRLIWDWENGYLRPGARWATAAAPELEGSLERHPQIREHLQYALSTDVLRTLAAPSLIGFMSYLLSLADRIKARAFFDALDKGSGLEDGSPVLVLRNRLTKEKAATRRTITPRGLLPLFIKAWNAYYEGRSLTRLKFIPDKEDMPTVAGLESRHQPHQQPPAHSEQPRPDVILNGPKHSADEARC